MIAYQGLYLVYLIVGICFILAVRGLASPKTAQMGNNFGVFGMGLAILATLLVLPTRNDFGILVAMLSAALLGVVWANKVRMTMLPQMIALLNGVGGLSSMLVGLAEILHKNSYLTDALVGLVVGAVAFSGSIVAFLKLQGWLKNSRLYLSNTVNVIVFF